jgi:hypothetical protein
MGVDRWAGRTSQGDKTNTDNSYFIVYIYCDVIHHLG